MKKKEIKQTRSALENAARRRQLLAVLSLFVVLGTLALLTLPATTLERVPMCGLEEHVHDRPCYLNCGLEEAPIVTDGAPDLACPFTPHVHTWGCYDGERLVCGYSEVYFHTHTDLCYAETEQGRALICLLQDAPMHVHGEECYTDEIVCGQEENHVHTDACFEDRIVCGMEDMPEHVHTTGCVQRVQVCTLEENHVHTDACHAKSLSCEYAEELDHVHTAVCFDAEGHAICGKVQYLSHEHNEACFANALSGHVHTDACYSNVPQCGHVEHVHTDACYQEAPGAEDRALYFGEDASATEDELPALSQDAQEATEDEATAAEASAEDPAAEEATPAEVSAGEATMGEATPGEAEAQHRVLEYQDSQFAVKVILNAEEDLPEDAILSVYAVTEGEQYDAYAESIRAGIEDVLGIQLLDISILSGGEKVDPSAPVQVQIDCFEPLEGKKQVVHFAEKEEETAEAVQDPVILEQKTLKLVSRSAFEAPGEVLPAFEQLESSVNGDTLIFNTSSFSVYGIVYTVDFHWEVNGKSFEFSIPGGGAVSFYDLVEVLGIEADDTNTEEDEIQELLDGVENIAFSDPELVSVSEVEEDSTVGGIKELLGLECEYSAELTEEQINEINAKTVKAGDWVLISLLPFDTEESLAVTMSNGDQFVIRVTDAQFKKAVSDVAGRHGVTNSENVKVYSGHNLVINTQIDTIEAAGTRVTLLGMESGSLNLSSWYQITYVKNEEPVTGYVETKYIDLLEMAAPVASENDAFKVTASWEEGVLLEGTVLESGVPSLTEEKRKDLESRALSILPVSSGKTLKITGIHFFDLSFMADGAEIEPNGEVNVSMELKQTIPTEENEGLHLVHFVGEAAELLEKTDFIKDENGDLSALDFTVGSFSTFAVVKTIETTVVASNGETYEVTVYYTDDANIPDGSTLSVTEFSEDSEKYEYARKAVLADKKEKNELVDLLGFGFAALDISILNPEGVEIEPDASVYVDLKIKSLPGVENLDEVKDSLAIQHHVEVEDGVVVETVFDGNAEASFILKTIETVEAEGNAVDPNSVGEDDFTVPVTVVTDSHDIEFEVTAFSTFTISWNNAYGNGVKVHYVDESGNELTVKNSTFLSTLNGSSTSPAYLIYDIDGYEYDHTYRRYYSNWRWYTQDILPELWRHNASYYGDWSGWMYSTGGSTLTALNSGDSDNEIYVVYKKKNDIVQGGTPKVKQSGDVDPPVDPRINKESTPNGDDTNTLALSLISDTAKLEVEKLADVIVVFDVSGSMSTTDMGENKTRLKAAQEAVNSLAEHLATKKNSAGEPLVRMSLIKFSTKASTVLGMTDLTTNGVNQISGALRGLSAGGGTNWDHALQLANEENDLDRERATFVIFVTDGDPTFRNARMDVTDLELQGETNDGAWYNYNVLRPNPYYLSDDVYGPADNDKTGKCYDAAVLQGDAIVHAGKNIYTIGISNDVTKVQTFNSAIEGNGAYLAANSTALQQAFSDIEASISGASGWGNIQMTDGITNLTNTVQKTGLTNVGGDFTYWIAPAPANWSSMTEAQKNAYKPAASAFIPWDPKAAGASLANYNTETGAVEWNMGSTFMPEAGVTYQVRFKVWPSQEAYDFIAKLNNGTIKYDELPAAVQAQIIKSDNTYTLKTNEVKAKTTYQTATKTGNMVTVSGETQTLMFPTVEDLNLHVDKMKVKKEWQNSLDPDSRWKSDVTLLLTDGSGNLYKSIELNEDNNYTDEENFISCGLAKIENGELIIYEQGHDFKLTEPEEYAYYWDLDSDVYRPMVIDAVLTMLVKADAPSGMENSTCYEEQGVKYYKIGGSTYKAISTGDAAAEITATNVRRSNLNLTKIVVDEERKPAISSEAFTFTITINDAKGADVWFSVQTDGNDTNTIVKELSTNATAEMKDGQKTGYYHAPSGSQITVSLQPGWNLRFTNLPNGTTYTISENAKENYTFVSAEIDNNGTFTLKDGTTTGTGTISESDKQYTVTYTNQAVTQQVYIQKTTQDARTPLQGAEFSLYTESGYNADPKQASKTGLTSGTDGKIDLGRLTVGKYYLVETSAPAGYILLTEPVEIKVTASGVQYKQITNSLSSSNEGVSGDRESGYTLVVTNNAGYELPSTGGSGTCFLYLFGIMLTGLAGAGLVMKRRRRNVA